MSIETDYREQVNRICDQAELQSGKDVLEMAKKYAETEYSTQKPHHSKKWIRRSIIIAAACVAVTGLTAIGAGAAGYGPFSGLFREKYKDDTTADIIEQGYLYDIGQSFTDGVYRADLIAVSGDEANPQLIIDLYIDDPDIVKLNDTVTICVYTLGVQQYEHELDSYGWNEGTAYRDSEIPNLYHATVRGAPVWMCGGEECVIDITGIGRKTDDSLPVMDETHMETRLTIPADVFLDTQCEYYSLDDGMVLPFNGINYHLNYAEYSEYQTKIDFYFDPEDIKGSELEGKLGDTIYRDTKMCEALTLIIDGVEYYSNNLNSGYVWCDTEGECGVKDRRYFTLEFQSVDYASAETVILSAGDASIVLKGSAADDSSVAFGDAEPTGEVKDAAEEKLPD